MRLLLKTSTARSRLKTIVIFAVGVALIFGYVIYTEANKTPYELADMAPTFRLMTLLRVVGSVVIAWAVVSLLRFRKKWWATQEAINNAPGLGFSIAVPRDLGVDVRQQTDFWRRLATYLPRPDELPTPHISMEVSGTRDWVIYTVYLPDMEGLDLSIREEITREWPGAQLRTLVANPDEVPLANRHRVFPDPAGLGEFKGEPFTAWTTLKLAGKDYLPLYQDTATGAQGKDPVEALLGALSALESETALGVQFLIRPALPNTWERWQNEVQKREGQIAKFKQAKSPVPKSVSQELKLLEDRHSEATTIWEVGIRVWGASIVPQEVQQGLDRIIKVLLAQTKGKYNQLTIAASGQDDVPIRKRHYPRHGGIPLTDPELGRLLHLPSARVLEPYRKVYRSGSTRLPPDPSCIVRERGDQRVYGTFAFDTGDQVFVGHNLKFTRMHTFVTGATGTGKSTVLANLVLQDFCNGAGGLVLDPHVDFIRDIMENIPLDQLHRVFVFDIRDRQPALFNICQAADGLGPSATVESIMGAVQVAMGANWGSSVRMQEILYNGFLLAVGALGKYASVMEVTKLLQDEFHREDLLNRIRDPVQFGATMNFWRENFAQWNDTEKTQAVTVALRRLNAISSRPEVRRSLAMPMNTLDLRGALDSGYLILVPLHISMGEEAQKILGALLVREFYNVMLMREDTHKDRRRNALLVIDEMASFIGDVAGFVEKLASQCRKYGAALIGAAQFYKQLPSSVLAEVLENFRTQMALSGGADYARTVQKVMGEGINVSDVQNLPPYTAYWKGAVFGGTSTPCLIQTLPPAEPAWSEPQPRNGYKREPPSAWSPLLPGGEPLMENPGQTAPIAEIFAYASHLAKTDLPAATDYVAGLPTAVFDELIEIQFKFDTWMRDEILANPGLIRDPVQRIYALSRLAWGIRNYMTDAMFIRDYYRRVGNGSGPGMTGVSEKGSFAEAEIDDEDFFFEV